MAQSFFIIIALVTQLFQFCKGCAFRLYLSVRVQLMLKEEAIDPTR
jgi:hypothetical protein